MPATLHCNIEVKSFTKSRFHAAREEDRNASVGAQCLLKFQDVAIKGEDLGGAWVALGKFCCPLDTFVPISFFHIGMARRRDHFRPERTK